MNTRVVWNCTGRHFSFVLLLLLGAIAGGYGVQTLVYAQNPREAEDTPETSKPKMQMNCPMMAGLKDVDLYADSPALLTARAEELGLNEEQTKQLEEIATSARQRARELLTAEQREALEEFPEGPLSMVQIAKMRMKGRPSGDDSKMMCPMCRKMMMNNKDGGFSEGRR